MIDIGANLTHAAFRDDVAEVVARARQAGVESIVITGTTVGESLHILVLPELEALAQQDGAARAAFGRPPLFAQEEIDGRWPIGY